jgi:hypothetical protein
MIIQLKNQKEDINKYKLLVHRKQVALIPNNRQINNIIVFECK